MIRIRPLVPSEEHAKLSVFWNKGLSRQDVRASLLRTSSSFLLDMYDANGV
jgi:hypothetical protein